MKIKKVNLQKAFASIGDYWNPKIIGELNGQQVKAARLKGAFVWHHHDQEDEMFWVIKGRLKMMLADKTIEVLPGEFLIIPKGVNHKPVADEEVEILLFEPASTLNTGNVENKFTRRNPENL